MNVPITCIILKVPVLDITVPITRDPCQFQINPRENENSYFETQTQQKENSAEPVTTNSIFPVNDLV